MDRSQFMKHALPLAIAPLALFCAMPLQAADFVVDRDLSGAYAQASASVRSTAEQTAQDDNANYNVYQVGASSYARVPPDPDPPVVIANPGGGSSYEYNILGSVWDVKAAHFYGGISGWSKDPGGNIQAGWRSGTGIGSSGTSEGVYLLIQPEAGETVGMPIAIDFTWHGKVYWPQAPANFNGMTQSVSLDGGAGYDAITLTLTSGGVTSVLWQRDAIVLNDGGDFEETLSGTLHARIGDRIGVHMGAGMDMTVLGNGGSVLNFQRSLTSDFAFVTPSVPEPGMLLMLLPGLLLVVLAARARRAG
jgi:hypothetical protein